MLGKICMWLVPPGMEIIGLLLLSVTLTVTTGLALFDVIVLSGGNWAPALFALSFLSLFWLIVYIRNNSISLFDED